MFYETVQLGAQNTPFSMPGFLIFGFPSKATRSQSVIIVSFKKHLLLIWKKNGAKRKKTE